MKKEAVIKSGASAPVAESDASTRARVARSILQHGPSTASELAQRLHLTPAAVRRHLSVLIGVGHLSSRQQRVYGARGRGRPAMVFALTDSGRAEFPHAYDTLAIDAVAFLRDALGEDGVKRFADEFVAAIATRFDEIRGEYDNSVDALVKALNDAGYVASVDAVATGKQLCQHHCPVALVAAEFPELCEAETRVFAQLLDSHVQRLATIAHGDGVCTTHVPRPVKPSDHPNRKAAS